jgi:peptidoglycan DL-endopeptidase LytE
MKCRKFLSVILFSFFVLAGQNFAQPRERVVDNERNKPTQPSRESQPTATRNPLSRPVLTNQITVVGQPKKQESLVKKTSSSRPTNPAPTNSSGNLSLGAFNQRLMGAMQSKIGLPYYYGSDGPNSYDCSGLVWSVFQSAGFNFTRTSAVSYFQSFEPVEGDERYKFGTLVFFNRLGHVGIVIDQNTFYHASSSKGVTFSKFEGYWEKRVVGFRRIPLNLN